MFCPICYSMAPHDQSKCAPIDVSELTYEVFHVFSSDHFCYAKDFQDAMTYFMSTRYFEVRVIYQGKSIASIRNP